MRKLRFVGLLLLLALAIAPAPRAQAQDGERQQILILHSYHIGYKWTDDINRGIVETLAASGKEIDVQIEYMDTKRIFDEEYLQYLYETYKYKFRDREFDAIISSDDNAFNFLLEHRDEIFPGAPLVFCGVNYFDPARLAGRDNITGVNETVDIRSGLDLAFALHPDTKTVLVVNDTTTTGQRMHGELTEVIPDYRDRAEFIFFENVELQDIEAAVRVLPPDSLVFYTIFARDKSGDFYEYDESILAVTENSVAPVYGTWDFSLGFGIVGGMLTSGYFQGETAAELALRILGGEDTDDIPVVMESPNRYMFDYEVVREWGIPLSSLPQDSIFVNKPPSFYEQYEWWIWGGAGALGILGVVILVLATANIRRRRAEAAVRMSNVELQGMRDLLERRVAERTAALDRRSSQLEAAAQVARDAAAVRDPETLLKETVRLISERMGFYHAGIFLIDEAGRYAVLRAASSEGGQRMLGRGHRLPVGQAGAGVPVGVAVGGPTSGPVGGPTGGPVGIVGHVAASGQSRIALDVGEDAVFFDNPDLPLTHSEMALPLTSRGKVVGVLDVQSTEPGAFSDEDVAALQTLADQVALAIENARLLEETQDRLQEISALAGEREQAGWKRLATERPSWGYTYDGVAVVPHEAAQAPEAAPSPQLTAALRVRQETVGRLELALKDRPPGEEEAELVQAVADQVSQALERARLFQETQRRATREQLIGEITNDIRSAVTIEDAIQRAVRQLGGVLGASEVVARIGTERELLAGQGGDGHE